MIENVDPHRVFLLDNVVQDYAWGSPSAIPELLGRANPNRIPQAELWMGAHPKAPSRVKVNGRDVGLNELIESYPEAILGHAVVERFGVRLPFLFKVLAAAKALSIQAHPNRVQAGTGYRRENGLGVPIDAPERNYRDSNHKPEVLCALTPFWALRGFRSAEAVRADFADFELPAFADLAERLGGTHAAEGFAGFLRQLLEMEHDRVRALVDAATEQSRRKQGDRFRWIERLAEQFPDDAGVVAPLFLNLVHLQPGEAVYQKAGELHAYLEGTGVELMANSDNVLRGGLTPKHIDVHELLHILSFEAGGEGTVRRRKARDGSWSYDAPVSEFRLSVIDVAQGSRFTAHEARSVEILLCVNGKGVLSWTDGRHGNQPIEKGVSMLIPSCVRSYRIVGDLTVYRADVPLEAGEE